MSFLILLVVGLKSPSARRALASAFRERDSAYSACVRDRTCDDVIAFPRVRIVTRACARENLYVI